MFYFSNVCIIMLLHVDFAILPHLTLFFGHQFASVVHTSSVIKEKFEDTKGVSGSRKSKKDRLIFCKNF